MTENKNNKTLFEKLQKLRNIYNDIKDKYIPKLIRNENAWLISSFILLIVLLGPEIQIAPRKYRLDDIAVSTVRAPFDITVEDKTALKDRREKAVQTILPVFDYLETAYDEAGNNITNYFNQGRALISKFMNEKQLSDIAAIVNSSRYKTVRSQLIELLKEDLPIKPPENILLYHVENNFSRELQDSALELLRRVSKYSIVSSKEDFKKIASNGFVKRIFYPEGAKTERIEDISEVKSIDNVASLLYQESISSNLSPVDKLYLRNFVQMAVKPNFIYNERLTEGNRQRAAYNVEPIYYKIKKGQVIVREGDVIDEVTFAKINALRLESSMFNFYLRILSLIILLVCYVVSIRIYCSFFSRRYMKVKNLYILFNSILIAEVLILKITFMLSESLVGHFLISPFNNISSYNYIIPYAVGGVLLTLLVNQQIAIILSIVISIFAGLITDGNFYVGIFALVSSFAGIYGIRHYRERSAVIKASLIISLFNILSVTSINLFKGQDNLEIFLFDIFAAFMGAFIVAFFVSFLLPVFETLFGIATDVKLLELSSMDRELLRRLSVEVPGTYQHSVMMGILAETAASEIGANSLFCRVAALYHDVGKLLTPEYFIENNPDAIKRHSKQTPHMSALILINHVKKGIELAREFKVPESIIDIIPQHHGTRLIGQFYLKAKSKEDAASGEVSQEVYRYPGPKPQSKEAAIIMIADSIEAASRTLEKNPNPQKIRSMVEEIVNNIFIDNQLDECQLTLIDLRKITEAFIKMLVSMQHGRVKYPQFEFSVESPQGKGAEAKNGK